LIGTAAALIALAAPSLAHAATVDVSIASPPDGAHSLSGTIPVLVDASADVGIYSVQLQIDGQYFGVPVTTPISPYRYEIDVDSSTLAVGTHTLTAIATDWSQIGGGDRWASDDVTIDVGPAYPTISITAPAANTLVRGTQTVTASTTAAATPATTTLSVDGTALASSSWDTTKVADGSHTISGTILDARGKSASASSTVTVDNTAPTTSITSPAAGTFAQGTLAAQASASDAYGVARVQFLIDGQPVGSPVTSPDGGSGYVYSASLSLSGLASGTHTVADVATDAAGNTATSSAVSFTIGNAPPTATITVPPDWTFAHGTTPITVSVSGGTAPVTATLLVDGKATGSPISTAPYVFSWDTTKSSDGTHTVAASVKDASGRTATSTALHLTVDNTLPSVYLIQPAPNTYFQGSLPVQAHASDAHGVQSVQFLVDGVASGPAVPLPDTAGGFTYSASLAIGSLANGQHTVQARATDAAGLQATSSAVTFYTGASPTVVTVTAPAPFTFVHGTTPVTVGVTGGTAPYSVQAIVDGVAATASTPITGTTGSVQWNTTSLIDGTHSLMVAVKDGSGKTSYSTPQSVTVDNMAPSATMYLPSLTPGYAYARIGADTTAQVHASDLFGVKSVQFTVDGTAVGPLLVAPDSGQQYLYSETIPASAFPAGMHTLTAIVTDNAGNTTTAPPVQVKGGPFVYVPVLNYHGIIGPLDEEPDIYDQTAAQADAELAYLKANGYQSITIAQYSTWLKTGALPAGITKPVLITVDDGLTDEQAWDPLLQKYGFKAVLYAVTGYADNNTPGANDPTGNMSWTQLKALAANGRWTIAFHAGQYGHGDFSDPTSTINLGSGQVESFAPSCFWYYGCLGTITTTTTTGTGRNRKTTVTTAPETPAQFESQVSAEVSAGIAELKKQIPTADVTSFACPWNACGQWTTSYNDASNTIQGWLPGYFASLFPIVFTQTNPITYGLASGTVGALNAFNRHYRFEVHTDTTIDQFAAALTDPAFANN
jgi:hypothetical protein